MLRRSGAEQGARPGELFDLLLENRQRALQAQGRSGRYPATRNIHYRAYPPRYYHGAVQGFRWRIAGLRGHAHGTGGKEYEVTNRITTDA